MKFQIIKMQVIELVQIGFSNISLERFWNVNIDNELTFFNWNCVLEKIVNLIPHL